MTGFGFSPGCKCCGPEWPGWNCIDTANCCSGAPFLPQQITIDLSAGTMSDDLCDACDLLNAEFTLDYDNAPLGSGDCRYIYEDDEFCSTSGECTPYGSCPDYYALKITAYLTTFSNHPDPDDCAWEVWLRLYFPGWIPGACPIDCQNELLTGNQHAIWTSDKWEEDTQACDDEGNWPIDLGSSYGGLDQSWTSQACGGSLPSNIQIEAVY